MGCELCGGDDGQFCSNCEPDYVKMQKAKIRHYPNIREIVAEEVAKAKEDSFIKIFNLHVRALSCHCECLGMNAENALAICRNQVPPYDDTNYSIVLHKWGLTNEKGEPTI